MDDNDDNDDNDDTHPPRIIVRVGMVFRRGQKISFLCRIPVINIFYSDRNDSETVARLLT